MQLRVYYYVFSDYFSSSLKNENVFEGDTVEFTCEVIEKNMPGKWRRHGVDIQTSDRFSVTSIGNLHKLTIPCVVVKDEGEYAVTVNGRTRKADLTVKRKYFFGEIAIFL